MYSNSVVAGLLILTLVSSASSLSRPVKRSYDSHDYYVLELDPSKGVSISECANALGAEVVEPAGELRDHWLLRVSKDASSLTDALQKDTFWKRDVIQPAIRYIEKQAPRQRTKRAAIPAPLPQNDEDGHSLSRAVAERLGIADPLFPDQWHLVNEEFPEHMLNATPVWDMGIMGEGVISAMVDDGLDYESDDLADNFVSTMIAQIIYLSNCYISLLKALMISMITRTFLRQSYGTIITVLAVRAKLLPSRMAYVVSGLLTSPKLRVFVFSPVQLLTWTRPLL